MRWHQAFGLVLTVFLAGCGNDHAPSERDEIPPFRAAAATEPAQTTPATFFFDDKPLELMSPDRRFLLHSETMDDGKVQLVAGRTTTGSGHHVVGTFEPPTSVLWSPNSDSFLINDQRGSGQTSYLIIAQFESGRFRVSSVAQSNIAREYNRMMDCNLSQGQVTSFGTDWLDASTIIVDVQAQLHSGGCPLDPFAGNRISLLVDARSGAVEHRRL